MAYAPASPACFLIRRATLRGGRIVTRFALLTVVLLAGCRSNNRTELIENELRIKDRQLEELRGELQRRDCDVRALEFEMERLQRQPKPGQPPGSPLLVESLTLGRLSGGWDDDPQCPGDEGLQLLVEPRDCDKQTVKAPGSLRVEAFEVSSAGIKTALSTWDINARELRRMWDNPVFGGPAYRVNLKWTRWPTTEKLRVVVRFVTPEGLNFEAEKDVTIRLPDRPKPGKPGGTKPERPPALEVEDQPPLILPPPRQVAPTGYRTQPLRLGGGHTSNKEGLLPPAIVAD